MFFSTAIIVLSGFVGSTVLGGIITLTATDFSYSWGGTTNDVVLRVFSENLGLGPGEQELDLGFSPCIFFGGLTPCHFPTSSSCDFYCLSVDHYPANSVGMLGMTGETCLAALLQLDEP